MPSTAKPRMDHFVEWSFRAFRRDLEDRFDVTRTQKNGMRCGCGRRLTTYVICTAAAAAGRRLRPGVTRQPDRDWSGCGRMRPAACIYTWMHRVLIAAAAAGYSWSIAAAAGCDACN